MRAPARQLDAIHAMLSAGHRALEQTTDQVGLVQQYNQLVSKASAFGVRSDSLDVNQYVTGKTLDGLYTVIGEQERKIRQDPVGSASAVVRKVFGAIK